MHIDCRQGRYEALCELSPVKSDDRNILRNTESLLMQGLDDAHCGEIVDSNYGSGTRLHRGDRVSRRQTSVESLTITS